MSTHAPFNAGEPLAYFHNQGPTGHFLTLKLEGTRSNRDAIGANVTVTAGERRQAASHLQIAHDGYTRLRAVPFLDRCNDELTACGLHPARRATGPARLSPREQSVARLAVRGLTNRQVAAELVISVKTVEVHLSHIFVKLEVSTRTQLAAKLAERYVSSQLRHRVLLLPRLPPWTDAVLCPVRWPAC